MQIHLQWTEGNKYAAWLVDENNSINVFLGYHFVYHPQLPLAAIQYNLEQGLLSVFKIIASTNMGVKLIGD